MLQRDVIALSSHARVRAPQCYGTDTVEAAMGATEKKSLGPSWYEAEAPYARCRKMKEPRPELVVGPRLLRAL
jgi:hypothetical protein